MNTRVNVKIAKKVVLVTKALAYDNHNNIRQAYLVERNNKQQLQSARNWGTDQCNSVFNTRVVLEPYEYIIDNKDLTVKIMESADSSYRGGKVSFWNCAISNGKIEVLIGINQEHLLSLIQQSTIINGEVQEKCSLMRSTLGVGVVHPGMKEWQESTQNEFNVREKEHIKKTSNWEIGKSYSTLTKEDMRVGDLYQWFSYTTEEVPGVEHNGRYKYNVVSTHYHFKLLDTPILYKNTINMQYWKFNGAIERIMSGEITKLSQFYRETARLYKDARNKSTSRYGVERYMISFLNDRDALVKNKFAPRALGKYEIIADSYEEELEELLGVIREIGYNSINKNRDAYFLCDDILINFGLTPVGCDKPTFNNAERQLIMRNLSHTIHIDFGDGIELTGER